MPRGILKRVPTSTLVVIPAIVALMMLQAGPALAHYTQIYHGSDTAWVTADHRTLGVQDNECDGHRVFAQIWTSDMAYYWAFYDANDCAPGASFFTTYNSDILITLYDLCEGEFLVSVSCTPARTP